VAWVRWEEVCRPKQQGGLGVKNLEKFNIALLGKWVWRLKSEKSKLWDRILDSKYGEIREGENIGTNRLGRVSSWWRDVVKIKEWDGKEGGWWLEKKYTEKVGKRRLYSFLE